MIRRAIALGRLLAALYLAWEFGGDVYRYRAMTQAIDRLERCETDGDCEQAWELVKAVKKGEK